MRLILILILLFVINTQSIAVILHPASEPDTDFSNIDIPDPNAIGRWGTNASCVAIAGNLVITTVHQEGKDSNGNPRPYVLRPVQIAGITYTPDQFWTSTLDDDIRIVKLRHANLSSYVEPYHNSDEAGKEIVIGGFGKPRGDTLSTSSTPYGYKWGGGSNTTLRFCTNRIDSVDPAYNEVVADFDDLPQNMSQSQRNFHYPTTFEGTVAHFDSGCGWFIKDGIWKIAGLTWGVNIHQPIQDQCESWFRNSTTLNLAPDSLYALRISDFFSWINSTISSQANCPYVETDLNDDCVINEQDLLIFSNQWNRHDCSAANNYCQGADIDKNNNVGLSDFAKIAADWLSDYNN